MRRGESRLPDWVDWNPVEWRKDRGGNESLVGTAALLGMSGLVSALPAAYLIGGLLGTDGLAAAASIGPDAAMSLAEPIETVDLQLPSGPQTSSDVSMVREFYNSRPATNVAERTFYNPRAQQPLFPGMFT